jgi:hypothetical protein
MFCPLCKAEYRPGFTRCADCRVALVDALKEDDYLPEAVEILWQGSDSFERDQIFSVLHSLNIRYESIDLSEPYGTVMPQTDARFKIMVRKSDLRLASQEVDRLLGDSGISDEQRDTGAAEGPVCPLCGDFFQEHMTECSDCKIPLVASLEEEGSGSVIWWSGEDPQHGERLAEILQNARIPCTMKRPHGFFLYASLKPRHYLRILSADLGRANQALEKEYQDIPEEIFALKEEMHLERQFGQEAAATLLSLDDWDPDLATAECWSSDDPLTAELYSACFRENGIGSRIVHELNQPVRIFVYPADQARAKEIIQEIVEAKPSD